MNLVEEIEISEKNVDYKDVIYNASVRELLHEINSLPTGTAEVALIGHNPTITYFAEYLTGESIGNMEPSSMVSITFKGTHWEEVSQGTGALISYFHPKELNV